MYYCSCNSQAFYKKFSKCPPYILTQARSILLITFTFTLKENISFTSFAATTILFRKSSSHFTTALYALYEAMHGEDYWAEVWRSWRPSYYSSANQWRTSPVKCGRLYHSVEIWQLFLFIPQFHQAVDASFLMKHRISHSSFAKKIEVTRTDLQSLPPKHLY